MSELSDFTVLRLSRLSLIKGRITLSPLVLAAWSIRLILTWESLEMKLLRRLILEATEDAEL